MKDANIGMVLRPVGDLNGDGLTDVMTVATGALALVTLGYAWMASKGALPEVGWLVYPLIGMGGLKLLLRDLPDGRYHLRILPPLVDFPSDDLVADTNKYVGALEEQVRRRPEQYFWVHRKFKGLPESYPDYYADLDAVK